MVDLLVSALIPTVLIKAADSLVQRLGEMWGINDQRERLHNMLLEILAVLPDAEDKAKSNEAVKSWLQKLKTAAYDAGDLLDKFCYEELRRDAVRRGHKVSNVSGFFPHEIPGLYRYKISGKLKKLVGKINDLVIQMRGFGFQLGQCVQVAIRDKTDSHVVGSKVVGRDEDKENITRLLLEESNNKDLKVVPVVGMGGLGKTTLAQLVYNDPRVKDHFKLPLWVCVSEDFNIGLLIKSVIELVIGKCEVPVENMELLRRRLHEVIGGKRYLLVLDDVWNDNAEDWDRLKALLNYGDSGSAIIVTTRSDTVASIMGYKLGFLGKDDSWKLFHKKAFSKGVKESGELVEIGKKMVQNCGGLPLAINTLGSLMSNKNEVREWSAILEESRIWEIRSNNKNVLRVLRLSYDHLPPYTKQCFAFCAVFPKDFLIDKEKLIQYWMASGFIPSEGPDSPEMIGSYIFDELTWRSFFQEVIIWKHSTQCKMHDLMHDLAQSIMGDECLCLLEQPTQINQSKHVVRHISYKKFPSDINNITSSFPTIRSLISTSRYGNQYVCNVGFPKSNALQILELHATSIGRTMVTPEKMKYLRYLEISGNFASLPEAITTLYLLQTLRLGTCHKLVKLPNGMKYMSSLRHIYIKDDDDDYYFSELRSMPPCLGQLNCLQVLTMYIVGTCDGNCIEELRNLNLHGTLHLYNIREVRNAENAMEANLIAKQNLDDLALCWGMPANYKSSFFKVPKFNDQEVLHCDPREVLDALKPCNNIKVLQVTQYPGNEFPVWITEYSVLKNLIELYIIDCKKCTKIPPVGKLPYLRILYLKFFDKLRHLCSGDFTSGERDEEFQLAFPALKKLVLFEMPILSSWCEGEVGNETSLNFPMLKSLDIIDCPKLTAMPSAPLLEKLSVKGNKTLQCIGTGLTKLQTLSLRRHGGDTISESESLTFQPWESLQSLELSEYNCIVPIHTNEVGKPNVTPTKCRYLQLESCDFFLSDLVPNSLLWFWKCFTCLQRLTIWTCENLKYWPEIELRNLNCLRYISVYSCKNFLGSRQDLPSERSITEALLPKLEEMYIGDCPNMIEIPKCSTSIKFLSIIGCKKLQRLPEWLGSMVSLKKLLIGVCDNLQSLPSSIGGLTSLETLEIYYCKNLANLPEGMEGLKALEVWIEECPHLERHFKRFGKYRRLVFEIRVPKIGGDLMWSSSPQFGSRHNSARRFC